MTEERANSQERMNILSIVEDFIYQVHEIRRVLLGVSMSAIILAPLALALSAYLFLHPSFFAVLDIENEFGLVLSMLLGAVIIISVIWLITGIRQYRSMSSWKSKYVQYQKEKEEMDRKIAEKFGLNEE